MDFTGQKLSEQLSMLIVGVFSVVSFILGFLLQSFNLMMGIFGGGVALAFAITVPEWPWFNAHPLAWLPPRDVQLAGGSQAAKGKRKPAPGASKLWGFL